MDVTEICSLLMLILAYVIIIMLIVIYEVTECQFSPLQQMFHIGNLQGPSSVTARNLVEVLFLLFLSVLNFWGMFVRVYPKILQGLTFLNSVKHITTILARCTS